jgi:hypothetical protein
MTNEMDFSNYTIDELVELKDKLNALISDYSDGHIYICKVRSYGRNWVERFITNVKTLQDLCYDYSGDNGIVDIYTKNTDLGEDFSNYGDTMIIKSLEDYEKWSLYEGHKKIIERAEQDIIEYAEDQERPYNQRRFYFGLSYTQEDVDRMKENLNKLPMDFEPPTRYVYENE